MQIFNEKELNLLQQGLTYITGSQQDKAGSLYDKILSLDGKAFVFDVEEARATMDSLCHIKGTFGLGPILNHIYTELQDSFFPSTDPDGENADHAISQIEEV